MSLRYSPFLRAWEISNIEHRISNDEGQISILFLLSFDIRYLLFDIRYSSFTLDPSTPWPLGPWNPFKQNIGTYLMLFDLY